jgi:hypothetical protein
VIVTVEYSHHHTAQAIETIKRMVANFERDEHQLLRRAREAAPDGMPVGRGFDEQSSTASGAGDPTGNAACERADPERPHAAVLAIRLLLDAATACGRADRAREPALPPVRLRRGTDGCRSCARYIDGAGKPYFSPVFRTELCRRCYGLKHDRELNPKGLDPPEPLIELMSRGFSWTVPVIEREMRELRRQLAAQPKKAAGAA